MNNIYPYIILSPFVSRAVAAALFTAETPRTKGSMKDLFLPLKLSAILNRHAVVKRKPILFQHSQSPHET